MTATLAVRPATIDNPAVRVVPAPRSEPLTDEERHSRGLDAPATAALLLPLDLPSASTRRRRVLVTLHGQGAGPALASAGAALGPASGAPPEPAEPSPGPAVRPLVSPARPATRLFLATCIEVMGGFRPMSQLRPLCLPDRFSDIVERLVAHPSTAPAGRTGALAYRPARPTRTAAAGRITGAPPRVARNNQTGPVDRAGVRRVQICDIGARVAEVAVVLGRRDQVWAMALRFEIHRGQWLCSLLEVI